MRGRDLGVAAVATGTTAAVVDVAGSLLHQPAALAEPATLAGLLATGVLVALPVAFVALLAARAIAERAGRDGHGAVVGTATTLIVLAAAHAPLVSLQRLPAPEAAPLAALVVVACGAVVAWAVRRLADGGVVRTAFAAPLVALLSIVPLHVERLGGAAVASARMAAVIAGWAAAAALVVVLARRIGRTRLGRAVPFTTALAIVAAGGVVWWPDPPARSAVAPPAGAPRGVVIVTVDTLRADAVRAYASDAPATPAFDAFAAEGVLFEAARSPAPWTKPAIASLHTGLSPWVHRVVGRGSNLPDQADTLAERLREAGYRTGAIGSNVFLAATGNFAQGFDDYRFFPRATGASLAADVLHEAGLLRRDRDTESLTTLAETWLRRHADGPFFLWLHYFDPHLPYEPPRELLDGREPTGRIGWSFDDLPRVRAGYFVPTLAEREWLRRLYDGEVRRVDAAFGRLLDTLDELGLDETTLVVLTSDHGEEFWEHGGFEHGHTMFDEQLRVPLIVRPPGGTAPRRVGEPVSIESVFATVLDLVGLEYDADLLDGPSLAGAVTRAASLPRHPHFATATLYRGDASAVIVDDVKYIQRRLDGRESLFDLAIDPTELERLAGSARGDPDDWRKRLAERRRDAAVRRDALGFPTVAPGAIEGSTHDELRSLGYVQ